MTVESITALKNYNPSSANERCDVLGYELPGDGGDGAFFWDPNSTNEDDLGTVIRPFSVSPLSAGRWKRIFSTSLNVKWFGAKGNNIANDTISITKAIITGSRTCGELIIPKGTYLISETIRADIQDSITIIGHNAIIKSINNNIVPHHILSIAPFPEKPFLVIGPTATGTDIANAFPNTANIKINLSGISFDGSAFESIETPTLDVTPIAIALVIVAEYVEVTNCSFSNFFGYGLRIHGARIVNVDGCNFKDVGGRGRTIAAAGVDEDGMGDAIYMTSFMPDFMAKINNSVLQGIAQLTKRSRIGITIEYTINSGQIIIENTKIRHYAKCLHNESYGAYTTTISNCILSDFNVAFAHTITKDTFVNIYNSLFKWDLMDGQEAGLSPLLSALAAGSNAKISFGNCSFEYSGLNYQTCVIAGIKNFTNCDFQIKNKNIAFSDGSNTIFEGCHFFDFGGSNSSFTNWTPGASTFRLSNCIFHDGGIVRDWSYPPKAQILMINCQHNKNNALLYPNGIASWADIFPYQDGLVTEHIVALPNGGTGQIGINALNCPSPLWQTRRFLVLVIGTDSNDSRKINRDRIINPTANGYYKTELVYTTAGFFQVASNTLIGGDNSSDGYNIYTPEGLTWKKNTSGAANVSHIKFLLIPKYYEDYI